MNPIEIHREDDERARSRLEDRDLDRIAGLLLPLASPVRLKILRYLTTPHYLEEVASHVKLTRQAARKHLDKLVAIGVLARRSATRDTGLVTEYVIDQQALFLVYDEFEKLGTLRRRDARSDLVRTLAGGKGARPRSRGGGPCFWIVRGLDTGERLELGDLTDREWVVGRDPRADLALAHDPYASNRHAMVTHEDGVHRLTDLMSTNGTFHNWERLPRGDGATLAHGDVVGVGKTVLLFWDARA